MPGQTSDPLHAHDPQWSQFGLYGGTFVLALIFTVEIVLQFTKPGWHLIDGPFDNLIVSGLVGLIVASATVRATVTVERRIKQGQRALADQLRALASEHDEPADLPPDNVLAFEAGRRLGRQEHHRPS